MNAMANFAPGLKEAVLTLSEGLRCVVFFACVVGLMLQVRQARAEVESVMTPIVRAIVIVGIVATLPLWFELTEKLFLSVADAVNDGYTQHPMQVAARLRATVIDSSTEFTLRRIGESMYKAFLFGAAKLVVLVASLLQVPFLVLQYILKLLCYLFLPVALGMFMIPSQAGWSTRYVQQTLAVLAWPVGFAVTDLVGYHLLTAYATNLAAAYNIVPGEIDSASFGSLLGGLLGALWVILGTVGTPFLMQALICSGSPLSHGGTTSIQQIQTLAQVVTAVKAFKIGGAAAALAGGPGSRGNGGTGLAPTPQVPGTPPLASSGPSARAADPAGDRAAATALAAQRLPAARTGI